MFIGEKNTPDILTYMRNVNLSSVSIFFESLKYAHL